MAILEFRQGGINRRSTRCRSSSTYRQSRSHSHRRCGSRCDRCARREESHDPPPLAPCAEAAAFVLKRPASIRPRRAATRARRSRRAHTGARSFEASRELLRREHGTVQAKPVAGRPSGEAMHEEAAHVLLGDADAEDRDPHGILGSLDAKNDQPLGVPRVTAGVPPKSWIA
jgi:hypothetical protein